MSKIAIVDDSKEQRESLRIALMLWLKRKGSTLEVIDIFPFKTYEEYYPWIIEEEVSVLILDERLHNTSEEDLEAVAYRGNDLVIKIRERFKDIPIFTVSAHIGDDELQARFSEFEYIISRDNFDEKYVDILIRSSQRYLIENQKELSEFDDLTKKVAIGQANQNDTEKLKALQLKLNIPFMNDLKDRQDWLEEYDKQISDLEGIKNILLEKTRK